MSRNTPEEQALLNTKKATHLALKGKLDCFPWMAGENNTTTPLSQMAAPSGRSHGWSKPYDHSGSQEQGSRKKFLELCEKLTGVSLYQLLPPANIPDDFPVNPQDLRHQWPEGACSLAQETKKDLRKAQQYINEAVLARTGDAGAVMIVEDFDTAMRIALREDGVQQGHAQGYAEGVREGRRQAYAEKEKMAVDPNEQMDLTQEE